MSAETTIAAITRNVTQLIHRVGRIPFLIIILWCITLWWGERLVFERSVSACKWEKWETWPSNAIPHHVLFVADPQLVDPHTYPGRPWPLSTLTVLFTDLYMRRTYNSLLHHTQPHTTLFLGDLFDGGREWATMDYESPEDRYKEYGTSFWLREYNRFMNMFIGGWYDNDWNGYLTGEGRTIVASLPGNHDLGFGGGINKHVRDRFEAHFGPSNRIDILGNHTFVTLDTVSLSAMDQVDPMTGSSGAGDGTGHGTKHMEVWKPVESFLANVKIQRAKAIRTRYQHLMSWSNHNHIQPERGLHDAHLYSLDQQATGRLSGRQNDITVPSSNFPTILMSHVPLFRNQDVTCGPLRERGNAIPLSAGYQYQNVLTPAISKDIVDHLDAEQITMMYSGDDHDYCEIEHGEFTGRTKEITVKSISWAMGVRKPGVQLASLWNPIDVDAIASGEAQTSTPRDTVQNHLCLLPDQLAIFIRYAQTLALSLIILLIRAVTFQPNRMHHQLSSSPIEKEKNTSYPLLPISRKRTPPSSPQLAASSTSQPVPNHISTSTSHTHGARTRGNGKLSGYGNIPTSSRSTSPTWNEVPSEPGEGTDDRGMPRSVPGNSSSSSSSTIPHTFAMSQPTSSSLLATYRRGSPSSHASITMTERLVHNLLTPSSTKLGELGRSLNLVAGPVLLFYTWLLWNG